ncbi:MAG: HlyD family efflux transporter periplasmic adaptor subunit, partial [Treponema sp.]|uniref:efflux RND transporter periplasmic adaptor subunit n=1 Tax=Treponema sp. TaxID=166 RepID=UPI00298DD533
MKKNIKFLIIIAGAAVVAVGLIIGVTAIIKKINTKPVYYTVTKEIYENVIEISGTVEAAQEQTLQALSDGTVMGVYVKEGDVVKKGDVILQLDDTTQKYNLAKQDYNIATASITGSARELALLRTERLALVQKVADRQVVATFNGLIAKLDVAVGDSLEAKDSVGNLVNVDYLVAEVEIPETDVSKLKVGQKVEFTFSAYKDKTVYGEVEGWPAIGEVTSRGATVVKAKIKITEYPKEILPNYSFTG